MNIYKMSKSSKMSDNYNYLLKIIEQKNEEIETLKKEKKEITVKYHLINNVMSFLPYHVYWKNKDGVYLGCNDEQARTLGFKSGKDVIGKTDEELPWKEGAAVFRKVDAEVMEERKIITVEENSILPDGRKAVFFSTKRPLYNPHNGKIFGVLGISVDITEIKDFQEREKKIIRDALAKKTKAAQMEEELRQAVMILTGSIVHDLRTPIATVGAISKSFKKFFPTILNAYQKAVLENLVQTTFRKSQIEVFSNSGNVLSDITEQMNEYINQTLQTLSRTLTKKLTRDDMLECSMAHCVSQMINYYPFNGDENKLIQTDLGQDFLFLGNEILMVRVITNIIKNSLYQIKKNQKGKVFISLEGDKENNILRIKDTAGGAKPEIVNTIFDGFKTTKKEGTGIGLAFCKKIINDFNGNIKCNSVYGDNIEFVISFPKLDIKTHLVHPSEDNHEGV